MARPRSDIRPRLLDSARARFLVDGVDGASLRRIARDAGTNVGMVYYYFKTKDELFYAVVEEVYSALLSQIGALLEANTTLRDRLLAVALRVGEMTQDELDIVRIVVRESLVASERREHLLERFAEGHVGLILGALQQGVSSGELDPRHPAPMLLPVVAGALAIPQFLRRLVGASSPLFLLALPSSEALAKASIDIILHGVGRTEPS